MNHLQFILGLVCIVGSVFVLGTLFSLRKSRNYPEYRVKYQDPVLGKFEVYLDRRITEEQAKKQYQIYRKRYSKAGDWRLCRSYEGHDSIVLANDG
jgi:hypothetical protein